MHRTDESPWRRRALFAIGALVAGIVAWLVVRAVVPRWWSHRMGNVIDQRLAFGSFVGIVIGLIFTVLPLLVLCFGWRFRRSSWPWLVGVVVAAALVASPNLATLGVVLGSGSAAHAGERTLDVEAPGFRGGSLVGAVVGVVLVVGIVFLARSRRLNIDRARRYRDELDGRFDGREA